MGEYLLIIYLLSGLVLSAIFYVVNETRIKLTGNDFLPEETHGENNKDLYLAIAVAPICLAVLFIPLMILGVLLMTIKFLDLSIGVFVRYFKKWRRDNVQP